MGEADTQGVKGMEGIVVATYATPCYETAATRLRVSAKAAGAAAVARYEEADFADLRVRFPEHFSHSSHGAWVWKPHVVARSLEALRDGAALLYCDATGEIVDGAGVHQVFDLMRSEGAEVAAPVLRDVAHNGRPFPNGQWTTPECLHAMGERAGKDGDYPQLSAATLFFIAGAQSRALVREWQRFVDMPVCCLGSGNHRHDQSVLSVLMQRTGKEGGALTVPDVTQFGPPGVRPCIHLHRAAPDVPRVVVITSTSGDFQKAVETVKAQTYPYISHVVVLDGGAAVSVPPRDPCDDSNAVTHYCAMPYRTGSGGHLGHFVYSTFPSLVCADGRTYIAYLDDDCRWAPGHIESMVGAITRPKRFEWGQGGYAGAAFSFRRILRADGSVACMDDCESLGTSLRNVFSEHFTDTNCWLLSAELAVRAARVWHVTARPEGGRTQECDRRLSTFVWRSGVLCVPTGRWTVDYTAKGGRSVSPDFFIHHNPRSTGGSRPKLYVYHLTPGATEAALRATQDTDPCDEWNPTQLLGLREHYDLVDGYAHAQHSQLPLRARVLAVMFHPAHIPYEAMLNRPDLIRVCYTAEGPNARHADQWRYNFLRPAFDGLLTYWTSMLRKEPGWAEECPHNTHWWDAYHLPVVPSAPASRASRASRSSRVCCVLEARAGTQQYAIDEHQLQCLDGLRQRLVDQDPSLEIDLYGRGWRVPPGSKACLRREAGKFADTEHARDVYARYTFALIVENCDADGYVSEKAYDALSVGTIPIYFGGTCPAWAVDGRKFEKLSDLVRTADVITLQKQLMTAGPAVLRGVSYQAFAARVFEMMKRLEAARVKQ